MNLSGQNVAQIANLARTVASLLGQSQVAADAALIEAYAALIADLVRAIELHALPRDVIEAMILDALTKASDAEMARELKGEG